MPYADPELWCHENVEGCHAQPFSDASFETLPCVHAVCQGGTGGTKVSDWHTVSLHVYANTPASAMARAASLPDELDALVEHCVGATLYGYEPYALPYPNQDPDRPDLSRVTYNVRLHLRRQ